MRIFLVLCVVMSLSACGMTKEKLGLSRQSPDETTVETRRPLSLPPHFDVRPQENGVEE